MKEELELEIEEQKNEKLKEKLKEMEQAVEKKRRELGLPVKQTMWSYNKNSTFYNIQSEYHIYLEYNIFVLSCVIHLC